MRIKSTTKLLLFFSIVGGILSGCNSDEKAVMDDYNLSLNGESENWRLTEYEVAFTSEDFKAGNGILNMKNQNEYSTKSFQFDTHAIINGEDFSVHSGSITGDGNVIDIAEEVTGTIETGAYLDKEGNPITIDQVNDIYMDVVWWDLDKNEKVKEKIDLLTESNKEALLN